MRVIVLLLSLLANSAFAGPLGPSGAVTDLYYVNPATIGISTGSPQPPYLSSLGLTQTAPQAIDTTKTNLILITAGQSNIADQEPSLFTPVNGSSLFQLNVFEGKIYPASDPLLGTTLVFGPGAAQAGGSPALRIADSIVTNAYFQRVYLVPIAVSGTAVAWWNTLEESPLLPLVMRRIAQRGIVCGGTNTTCVIIWCQGEEDEQLGTSQVSYAASFSALVAGTATAGFIGHWYIAKQTYVNGSVNAGVQAAQVAAPNSSTIFAGPNADVLIGSVCGAGANAACRQADGVHFSDAGGFSYAAAWVTALHAGGF